jgi:hypothetical protein
VLFQLVIAFVALVCTSEVEDVEQKKRGAGKTTSLNAIPSGAQKTDYSYNLYPSSQSNQGVVYQSQVPNSFYPSQNSQYYTPSNIQPEQQSYSQQPPINLIPPTTPSQFVPLNFIPNPGYQAKYQIVPSKTANGNIQLAIVQQPANYQSPILQYPQGLLQQNPTNQFQPQQNLLSLPQGQFNVAPYQLPLGNSYLGQPSPMFLVPQANPSLYNNLIYPNPLQNVYNYYPSNSQAKYGAYATPSPQTVEYDKAPQQAISKEDNDIGTHTADYISGSDSSYKNAYASSRSSSYTKLK